MAIEIKAPTFPESIADGTVTTWHKRPGEPVSRDEVVVEIETDKVVIEVVAPADGTIAQILKQEGDLVLSEEVVALFTPMLASGASATPAPKAAAPTVSKSAPVEDGTRPAIIEPLPVSPAARKLAEEQGVRLTQVEGTGKAGRVTKEDVVRAAATRQPQAAPAADASTARLRARRQRPAASENGRNGGSR